jgi:hypothetical protein
LYNYTQTPTPTVWKNIEGNLDGNTQTAKIIPFANRFKRPLRYLAAASIIGLLAITGTLLLKRTESGSSQAGTPSAPSGTAQTVISLPKQNKAIQNFIASAPTPAVKGPFKKKTTFKRKFLNLIPPQELLTSIAVAGEFIPNKVIKEALFNNRSIDNYMVYSDGTGMAMRMPKKLFPLVQCEDGDATCQKRIKFLQQKISSASMAADFGAILEMLHEVQ